MKIKGKIALWYWLILIGINIFLLYELIFDNDNIIVLLITLVFVNLIFLPIVIRNYVLIDNDILYLYFGFFKDSMQISDIKEIRKTHYPISSSAASLDRLQVKGSRQEMMLAIVNKELFMTELKKMNPNININ